MISGSRDDTEPWEQHAARRRSAAWPTTPAWAFGWACIVALAAWMAQLSVPLLVACAVAAAGWAWGAVRGGRRSARFAAVALWLAVGLAGYAQLRLEEVSRRWPTLRQEVEEDAAEALNEELDALVRRGEGAVAAAGALRGTAGAGRSPRLFQRLEELRREAELSALAVFDSTGAPVLWAGQHRGAVPVAVRQGSLPYVFHEGPLFGYLYFVRPLPAGGAAVGAVLLESSLPGGVETGSFSAWFARRHGLTPRFTVPGRARCETIWDWSVDQPILSACFLALTQQDWWARVQRRGRWAVGAAWVVALAVLGSGWYRQRRSRPELPVAAAALGLLLMPLGRMLGAETLDSSRFVLPLPFWDVDLGVLLVLLGGVTVWMLTRVGSTTRQRWGWPWWAQGAAMAAYIPLALLLVRVSASGPLLGDELAGGFVLQLATALLIATPLYLVLRQGRAAAPSRRTGAALLAAAGVAAALLAAGWVLLWRPDAGWPPATGALWGVPVALAAAGLARLPGRLDSLRGWLVAGLLAAAVALSSLWQWHVEAKLQAAELDLARLGTETDPYLDFLLRLFGDRARALDAEGETGVNLLYRSWVASGLAHAGYEARLTLWREGIPFEELRLTEYAGRPELVTRSVARAAGLREQVVNMYRHVPGLHYLLLVPLSDDRILSVAVPPRSRLGRATAVARFLRADDAPDARSSVESLYLVPSPNPVADSIAAARGGQDREVEWMPTQTGWRSEASAHFPTGWMHAHLFVRTSGASLLLVRGVLTTVALLSVLLLLWLLGGAFAGRLGELPLPRREWARSFRGRLTLTLFVFFLLPTGIFGVVAYTAVSREVVRSAESFAYRALEQTVGSLSRAVPLAEAAMEIGVDLLMYREGALSVAAAPEAIELGLFDAWLPPAVYLTFASGEDLQEIRRGRLGENEYLVGYRRLDPSDVLAAPIPLAADEIARRQLQFRDIAILLSLLGAALSVVLSLLVGRALARPLDELSRAASTVGAGNLRVRLAEGRPDEFGTVYRSFNRMVARLRRARAALLRETRRTETIVAEAATGVLALDAYGNVELMNPRASEILGASLEVGQPLPRADGVLGAVADAFHPFWRSGQTETGAELEVDGRLVRVRMRRLSERGGGGGTVLALEDVTSEVQSARVLAWGEMARQVAHEIKNPLTPIKLAVQHLRRAFVDGRPDYDQILDRNVEAILREIDRLGEIARAFARFGTPDAAVESVEEVEPARVILETLALYRGSGGGIDWRAEVEPAVGVRAAARLGELKEVLVNLLENAREAVGEEGEICVAAEPSEDGQWVEVEVVDTGEGIASELLPRIFEPRFSTRTSGTGLGLAIVRRMVESWGGEVAAESEVGVGTRIRIRLRRADPTEDRG